MKEGGIFRDGYQAELDELRDIQQNGEQWLTNCQVQEQRRVNTLAKQQGLKETKVKVNFTRGHGYYIEVKSSYPVPEDYSIIRALKDRTRYATPELLKTANKILTAGEDIGQLEYHLYQTLLAELEPFVPRLLSLAEGLAELDVLLTFAHIANAYGYTRPAVVEDYGLSIRAGRHPVVERILGLGEFVPNDVLLNAKQNLLIISGSNMGGKSTIIKMTALITLLAQIGSFVPAQKAKIGVVDQIFTRVGIVDDIWRGQSHFMLEMSEASFILNQATKNSLVLLDEIGRGTSTNTGLAIGYSIAKYIHNNIGAKTLFATHFHQLNEMETAFTGIKNYHMAVKYEGEDLIFLHKLVPGGTDESHGIEVAQLAGFPTEVIADAKETRELIDQGQFFTKTRFK